MKRIVAVALAVAVATGGGWLVGADGWAPLDTDAASAQVRTTSALTPSCATVRRPFNPKTVTIPGITSRAKVVTPPRLPGRVPGAPPLTEAGKEMFAWDKASDVRPGDKQGVVRMNAHVWPDGSAVGNRMLKNLEIGDRIVVRGKDRKLCYRVTDKVIVDASKTLPRYYRTWGKPRLGIVVCSGKRLGPGVWTKRTVWFAKAQF